MIAEEGRVVDVKRWPGVGSGTFEFGAVPVGEIGAGVIGGLGRRRGGRVRGSWKGGRRRT
jgi:hypothetical protein